MRISRPMIMKMVKRLKEENLNIKLYTFRVKIILQLMLSWSVGLVES